MLELGVGAGIVRGVGWLLWCILALALYLAITKPKTKIFKGLATLFVLGVFFGPIAPDAIRAYQYKQRYVKAKALFEQRCKTAGTKIYRVVEEVSSISVDNPRPERSDTDLASRDWPGAGFPRESGGAQYIMEFLYFNKPPLNGRARALGWLRGGIRGYKYVYIHNAEGIFRYSLLDESKYSSGSDPLKAYGKRELINSGELPRYHVIYKNIDDPVGRANWIAGGHLIVMDMEGGEKLGEFIRYAFEPGFGDTRGGRIPWAFAVVCPANSLYGGSSGHIRSFVETVIRPKQEE